jgi:hypothetical protein
MTMKCTLTSRDENRCFIFLGVSEADKQYGVTGIYSVHLLNSDSASFPS